MEKSIDMSNAEGVGKHAALPVKNAFKISIKTLPFKYSRLTGCQEPL